MRIFKLKFPHRPCRVSAYRTENGQARISKRNSVRTNKPSLKNHTSTASENPTPSKLRRDNSSVSHSVSKSPNTSALKRRLSASGGTGQNTLSKRVSRSWSLCPKLTKGSLLRTRPWRRRANSEYDCSLTRQMRQLRLWASYSQRRVQPQRGSCLGLKLSHPNRHWTNYRQQRRPCAS